MICHVAEIHNHLLSETEGCLFCEINRQNDEISELKDVLEQIRRAACGEDQVADDDTGGLHYIYKLANKTLGLGE